MSLLFGHDHSQRSDARDATNNIMRS
jgi:hypothetical protein